MTIEQHTIEEWMTGEKPYKIQMVEKLLQDHTEEETAKILLTSNGVENTKSFGGSVTQQADDAFWNRFSEELKMFICGHPKYKKYRDEIEDNGNIIGIATTAFIASAIAPFVGLAASFITVPIMLMLKSLGAIGINTYCRNVHY